MRVLLVHGLGRTPAAMLGLAAAVRRAGHAPSLFGYAAWAERYDRIVARLARRLAAWEALGEDYGVVGHSLGGVLLRSALAEAGATHARALVLLGSPARPPRLARAFAGRLPYRVVNGDPGQRLADERFFGALPSPAVRTLVIAGTRDLFATRRAFGGAPNDGVVALDEAVLPAPAALAEVPAGHTFMMNHAHVRRLVCDFLGRDDRA